MIKVTDKLYRWGYPDNVIQELTVTWVGKQFFHAVDTKGTEIKEHLRFVANEPLHDRVFRNNYVRDYFPDYRLLLETTYRNTSEGIKQLDRETSIMYERRNFAFNALEDLTKLPGA